MLNRVVVVIPVFQAQSDFNKTIATVAQSTLPCDIIVIDDGSAPPLDSNGFDVTLIRLATNMGIVAALNAGMELAIAKEYEYIARIDAGDLAHSERFAKQVAHLDAARNCMLVGCDVDVLGANGEYSFTISPPRKPMVLSGALKERVWLLHSTVMFRTAVFKDVGLYTKTFEAAEDYDLFMRIATKYPIGLVPETLATCIRPPTGISTLKARTQLTSRLRIQMTHFSWASFKSYSGVARTLMALALSRKLKTLIKRRFLYKLSRQGPDGQKIHNV